MGRLFREGVRRYEWDVWVAYDDDGVLTSGEQLDSWVRSAKRELYRLACELEDTKIELNAHSRLTEGHADVLADLNSQIERQAATIENLREQLLAANDRLRQLTPLSGTFGQRQEPRPSSAQVDTSQWVIANLSGHDESSKNLIARAVQILTEALA